MKRLAHRGYSDLFPENTMSAFEKAAHSSFEGIETDVQMTKDGALVLLHDDKINRTSDGKGVLRHMTFKEARQYNYNNKMDIEEQIPTLDSLLTLLDSTDKLLNIEIKDTVSVGLEEKLRDIIMKYHMTDRIYFSSTSLDRLLDMRALMPDSYYALIVLRGYKKCKQAVIDHHLDGIHSRYSYLTHEEIVDLKSRHIKIGPGQLKKKNSMTSLKKKILILYLRMGYLKRINNEIR